jgi:hypothetical protein
MQLGDAGSNTLPPTDSLSRSVGLFAGSIFGDVTQLDTGRAILATIDVAQRPLLMARSRWRRYTPPRNHTRGQASSRSVALVALGVGPFTVPLQPGWTSTANFRLVIRALVAAEAVSWPNAARHW